MGRKALGPIDVYVAHVKDPSNTFSLEKGIAPVFLAVAAECPVAPCKTLHGAM